jgi:SMC interacting uncharacterized protein involved in chromosome segregation
VPDETKQQLNDVRFKLNALRDEKVDEISGDLKQSINDLNGSIQKLLKLVKQANVDLEADSKINLSAKLDILIQQNEDVAKALLKLLELHHEHLPKLVARTGRQPMPDLTKKK